MPCPYCPYMIKIMRKDQQFRKMIHSDNFKCISQFILRHRNQVKLFIESYEKKDPDLLKIE